MSGARLRNSKRALDAVVWVSDMLIVVLPQFAGHLELPMRHYALASHLSPFLPMGERLPLPKLRNSFVSKQIESRSAQNDQTINNDFKDRK